MGLASVAALAGIVAVSACGNDAEARDPMPEAEPEVATEAMLTETAYGIDDLDMDGDSELDANEVHEWAEAADFTYVTWVDDTGSSTGLYESLYQRWDTDGDGTVSEAEWDVHHAMYPGLTEIQFVDWDLDGDSELVSTEFVTGFEATGLHSRIDADSDGLISTTELRDWFFDLVDANDDGSVDATEWEMAEPYYNPDWRM